MSLGIAGALLLGCGVSASSMTYYSRRYIGELALLTSPFQQPKLRISVLDFWGHRQENIVDLLALDPILKDISTGELSRIKKLPLVPIQVSGDKQYYISLRFGIFPDRDIFQRVMSGDYS